MIDYGGIVVKGVILGNVSIRFCGIFSFFCCNQIPS